MKSREGAVNHEVACGSEITAKSYVLNRMPDEHVWCKENRIAISLNPESEIRVLAIWKAPATSARNVRKPPMALTASLRKNMFAMRNALPWRFATTRALAASKRLGA